MYIYIYIYIYIHSDTPKPPSPSLTARAVYGQFSKCHVCFCGLDPGNLKFWTVRTNKQHICF